MKWLIGIMFVIYIQSSLVYSGTSQGVPEPDIFKVTTDKMRSVTAANCHTKSKTDLELLPESVAQVKALYWKQFFDVIYANRSKLLHLHNTAMSRGLYFSFLYAVVNDSRNWHEMPDPVFLFMKSSADVSANQGWIDGSALMFDNKCFYPKCFPMLNPFIQNVSLFGVRAWKGDSKYDTKWVREPINSTNKEMISGNVFKDNPQRNYTNPSYKYCPYTRYDGKLWWPDDRGYKDSYWKQTYFVGIKFSNTTGHFKTDGFENISFYGPPTPWARSMDVTLPVLMTRPYFDCGRSNKWIVSMTSPVTEFMVRYSDWLHLRRPTFTAIAAMDMEFEKIDVNPCRLSIGNPEPNMFAGTARCRLNTTVCEPLNGFGFRRGGYQCVCRAGLYYPWNQQGPFQGVDIERATEEEYNSGAFDCVTHEALAKINGNKAISHAVKEEFEMFDEGKWSEAQTVMQKAQLNPVSCYKPITLTKGIISGAPEQFEAQGRTALGIAHFLSNFLQNSWALHDILYTISECLETPYKHYLNESHVFADVIATLMGDIKLSGVGVYFDRNKFATAEKVSKELFGPYVHRSNYDNNGYAEFRAIDLAGYGTYTDEDWFVEIKRKWAINLDSLDHFSDSSATFTDTKISYRAPVYTDGEWTGPMYKCNGMLSDWVFTYRVPFFGSGGSDRELSFMGVVSVDVDLKYLDINQCPAENTTDNVFSNTAKCHYESQYCVPVPGTKFTFGRYKCVLRQGYALPADLSSHQDNIISGKTMEEEYGKKERNEPNRYDDLKGIRISAGAAARTSGLVLGGSMFIIHVCVAMVLFNLMA